MKPIIFIAISLLLLGLDSCKKGKINTNGTEIRVENLSAAQFDSVSLWYETSDYNYGTLFPNFITSYHFFKSMPDDPAVKAKLGSKWIIIGPVIPPNSYPPYLSVGNGTYTVIIFPDSSFPNGYNAKFVNN
jgi:hypothetical protein